MVDILFLHSPPLNSFQEQNNAMWQSKYKKSSIELQEAEERSDAAEAALQKARQRMKTTNTTATSTRAVYS